MQKAKEIVNRILMERQRQIEEKGWTPEHDMEHSDGSIAGALIVAEIERLETALAEVEGK